MTKQIAKKIVPAYRLVAWRLAGFVLVFGIFIGGLGAFSNIATIGTSTQASRNDTSERFSLAGTVIGAISALVSIGGGALTVPYLAWQNVEIKKLKAQS